MTPRQELIGVDLSLALTVGLFIIATWARVSAGI